MNIKVRSLVFVESPTKRFSRAITPFGVYVCEQECEDGVFYWALSCNKTTLFEQGHNDPSYTLEECQEAAQSHWEALIHSLVEIED